MKQSTSEDYPHGEEDFGKHVAEYVYEDENGEPYLRVVKTDKKKFPQYHWTPGDVFKRRGGWDLGAPKGPKIPYKLPILLDTPKDVPIWICEGEKDADTLYDTLGLISTTNSEGAGQWTDDLNRWFAGRETVYVLEDNDAPGRKHAIKVARNLVDDVVNEVRIVRFTDVPEHEDITYWLQHGGSKELLLERAAAAPLFKKKATIAVVQSEPARVLDEILAAMKAAELPVLVRGGNLVEPLWEMRPAAKGRKTKVVVLKAFKTTSLKYMINKHAVLFTRYDKKEKRDVPIGPPDDLVLMLLQLGHTGFPHVAGTISSPTMRGLTAPY